MIVFDQDGYVTSFTCNSDKDCNNYAMVQHGFECYLTKNQCGCLKEYAKTGEHCEIATTTTVRSSLFFLLPLMAGLFIFIHRSRMIIELYKRNLFVMNASGITTGLAMVTLFLLIISSLLHIIAYYIPNSQGMYIATDASKLVVLVFLTMSVLHLLLAFMEIAQSMKKSKSMAKFKLPLSVICIIAFAAIIVMFSFGKKKEGFYIFALVICVIVACLFVGPGALYVKFFQNFTRGKTRRAKWREWKYGGSCLIALDIMFQLIRSILCGVDVAAGYDNKPSDEQKKQVPNHESGKRFSTRLIPFYPTAQNSNNSSANDLKILDTVSISSISKTQSLPNPNTNTFAKQHPEILIISSDVGRDEADGYATNDTSSAKDIRISSMGSRISGISMSSQGSANELKILDKAKAQDQVMFSKKSSTKIIHFLQRLLLLTLRLMFNLFFMLSCIFPTFSFTPVPSTIKTSVTIYSVLDGFLHLFAILAMNDILWFLSEPILKSINKYDREKNSRSLENKKNDENEEQPEKHSSKSREKKQENGSYQGMREAQSSEGSFVTDMKKMQSKEESTHSMADTPDPTPKSEQKNSNGDAPNQADSKSGIQVLYRD